MTKRTNGAGTEQLQFVSSAKLNDIMESIYIYFQSLGDILLPYCTEEGTKMDNPVNAVINYD